MNISFLFSASFDTTTAKLVAANFWKQNNEVISNDIVCLMGTYTGTWKGSTIVLEVVDARYNNILSFKGLISGYVKYKNKVYPVKGTLRYQTLERRYTVIINMLEYDTKNKISFDFNGYITCYQDGSSVFEGMIITPGYSHPEMEDITLRKKVK